MPQEIEAAAPMTSADGNLCVVGIDPGLTGALAFYFPCAPERVAIEDMPVADGMVDPHALERRIRQLGPAFAAIERQGPRPTDGCKQSFSIGASYATARTVLAMCRVPMHLITSSNWKRHHGILAADDPKEAGRALALRLFPASAEHFGLKKHHNRSDAALIARFAADTING